MKLRVLQLRIKGIGNKTIMLYYLAVVLLEMFDYFYLFLFPVLFKKAWKKSQNFAEFDKIMIIVLFGIMLLPWLLSVIVGKYFSVTPSHISDTFVL